MTPEVQHNASYRLLCYSLFPLFLIIVCPPAAIIMWYTNVALSSSLTALAVLFTQKGFLPLFIRSRVLSFFGTREAWFVISIFMITQLLLIRIVPGETFRGSYHSKRERFCLQSEWGFMLWYYVDAILSLRLSISTLPLNYYLV